MAKLIAGHEARAATLRDANTSSGARGEVSANLLNDCLEWHENGLWMTKASTR